MDHCPACAADVSAGSRFCPACSAALAAELLPPTGPYQPAAEPMPSPASPPVPQRLGDFEIGPRWVASGVTKSWTGDRRHGLARILGYNSAMTRTQPSPFPFPPKCIYCGANIPLRAIRRYARAIAEEFHPDKIILFGSYAYGRPHENSDVDLLVVMPARNQHAQALRIRWRLAAPFPLDLIVRTPQQLTRRLKQGESFLTAIVSRGKILYEKDHPGVGQESRARLRARQARQPKQGSGS